MTFTQGHNRPHDQLQPLRCPYCGGEIWASDLLVWCVGDRTDPFAQGCGAGWDCTGRPENGPAEKLSPDTEIEEPR